MKKGVLINNVNIYPFTSQQELIQYVDEHKGILVAINAEKILHATQQTRDIINQNIGYCDGAGAVMALKRKGFSNACKIAGCDLWLEIVNTFHDTKSFYLVGGKQDVIEETEQKLTKEYSGINILGIRNGYFSNEQELQELVDDIAAKQPEVVFVAMGSPKQELLMNRMKKVHPNAIYQGLGGSFDVYTGHVERAPKWWIDHNIEFVYRLIKQPSRIKRQIHLLKFLWWILIDKI
jgi:UDP-N-acetyl-D-mannosaminouronate:lipid I N-acetyl-D-mannosaminouronosyltransferase